VTEDLQYAVHARRGAVWSAKYTCAEPLLLKGYDGMKTREAKIQKKSVAPNFAFLSPSTG
jgi:hypothetical protein